MKTKTIIARILGILIILGIIALGFIFPDRFGMPMIFGIGILGIIFLIMFCVSWIITNAFPPKEY